MTWLAGRQLRWPTPRLKDIAEVVNGFPFPSERFSDSTGVPLVRIRDLADHSPETFFEGDVPAESIVEPGDLLIGMDGDFNSATWRGPRAALNQRMCKLVARPGLDQRFLSYFVDLPLRAINEITYFTTVKHLSSADLMNEPIPYPPLAEQLVIVDYLDTETARIDALIAKKQQLISLLEERFEAAREQLLTRPRGESLVPSRTGFFAEVPGRWQETTLRHLGVEVQTGPFGSQLHAEEYVEGGWPVVNPANIRDGRIRRIDNMTISDAKRDELSRHILRHGDIVFGRRGEMGRAGLVGQSEDGWLCGTGSLRLRIASQRLDPGYLAEFLQTGALRNFFTLTSVGSTMDNLNSEILLSMPCLVPSLEQQRLLVGDLVRARAHFERLADRLTRQLDLLIEHRQALITAAVTGEMSVPSAA